MIYGQRSIRHTLRARLAIALMLAPITAVHAEDDGWLEFEENVAAQRNRFELTPAQFDQWVFQQHGQGSIIAQRKKLNAELALMIEEIGRPGQLSEAQQQKLRLAGQCDIRQFFDQYAEIREKFMGVRQDQEKFNKIWQDIQPLQVALKAGLFRRGSMFEKVMEKTLDPSQDAEHQRAARERRQFRYRALVKLYLMLLEKRVPLDADERAGLQKLILAETKPPNVFGTHDQLYIQYHISQIAKKKVEAIIRGPRGRAILKAFQQGKGYERHLKQQGIVPFEDEGKTDEDLAQEAIERLLGRKIPDEIQDLEVIIELEAADDPFGE